MHGFYELFFYFVICVYVLHVRLCNMLMLLHYFKRYLQILILFQVKINQEKVDFHFVPDYIFFFLELNLKFCFMYR